LSNAHAGNDFETIVQSFFAQQRIFLQRKFQAPVGVADLKKMHRFDLGSENPSVLVECKSHTWTQSGNPPSAKLAVWNEAMYYFHLAPGNYRKVLFVLKHSRRDVSLASYYLKTYSHLVPPSVEVWEYDTTSGTAERLR
jgi:hypothetical protein